MSSEKAQEINPIPVSIPEKIVPYWQRRKYIAEQFIKIAPEDQVLQIETESGLADVRVLSTMCEIPDDFKTGEKINDPSIANISVFVPGMFEVAQNYGSHPLESRLAGGLLTSEADAIIMLKAEGQDPKAFEEVHKTTSTAAFQVLKNQISKYLIAHPDCKTIDLKVLGYSEGSTQGASLTARIIEHIQEAKSKGQKPLEGLESLNMQEYLSVCGGGLAGNENVADVDLGSVLINNVKAMNEGQRNEKLARDAETGAYSTVAWTGADGKPENIKKGVNELLQEISDGVHLKSYEIDPKLVEGYQKSLEVGAGEINGVQDELMLQETESLNKRNMDDVRNVSKWLARFFATNVESFSKKLVTGAASMLPGGVDTLNRVFGTESTLANPVPLERVKALFTMNPDYRTIVDSQDTRLTVVAGSKDIYFPGKAVADNLQKMVASSTNPTRAAEKTLLLKSDIPHEFPHGNTDGLAYMTELLRSKAYSLENTNNA